MLLSDKTVLISGVGPGLGKACAAAALRDGANLVITARNADRLGELARDLDPTGDHVVACAADITDRLAVDAAVDVAVERFGRLDGVVSVAALDTLMGRLIDVARDDLARVLEVNVVGPANLVAAAKPALEEAGGGSVVLIGSQAGLRPAPAVPQGAYGASKAALLAAAREWAHDLGAFGIRVNTVVPSWMWGPNVEMYCQWQAAERNTEPEVIRDEIAAGMVLREMPTVDDVAESVMFFLSDRARMVTGQRLLVNAGEYFDT